MHMAYLHDDNVANVGGEELVDYSFSGCDHHGASELQILAH